MVSMLMAGAVAVKAATLEVGPGGYPYTSIQTAINDAAPGDVVLVHDGTYIENINFQGKAITVRSENGAAQTIIDGNSVAVVVNFSNGEGAASVLDGFTLTRGHGGILCASSSPTIRNCIISKNTYSVGAGVDFFDSSANIINCVIAENRGGLPIGSGIFCDSSSPTIINCIVSNNTGTLNGEGILCENTSLSIVNSIIWSNGIDKLDMEGDSTITITHSDIEGGWAGAGNIDLDPLFISPSSVDNYLWIGNYHLRHNSPCFDAANSDNPAPATDADGNSRYDDPNTNNTGTGSNGTYYDMGAYEYTGVECVDSDTDGYYSEAGCGTEVDCADGETFLGWHSYPGADELCDGFDNDCDGTIDEESIDIFYADLDYDGYVDASSITQACPPPPGYLREYRALFGECNDNDPNIHPGVPELCDGIDNNCDGNIDENLTQSCGSDVGECQSGTQTCSAGSWGTCVGEIGPSPEVCDNLDNNCDGNIDEGLPLNDYYLDGDGDTYGDPNNTIQACAVPPGYVSDNTDCDDSNDQVNPGKAEVCDNLDNNCDGNIDENLTQSCGSDVGECQSGTQTCSAGSWGTCVGEIGPSPEICDNLDNNCDGNIDEGLTQSCGSDVGECQSGTQTCSAGSWGSCVGEIGPSPEICDNLDNNCDGNIDEGLTQSCGSDVGECQSGTQTCSAGSWGTCVGEIGPSPEICDDLDNNCDGNIDEGLPLNDYYLDGDGDTYGDPNNSIQYCGSAPGGYVSDNTDCNDSNPNINPAACDIKRNGIDEDCDGSDRKTGPPCP